MGSRNANDGGWSSVDESDEFEESEYGIEEDYVRVY
jgi:hypothetical protein